MIVLGGPLVIIYIYDIYLEGLVNAIHEHAQDVVELHVDETQFIEK